MDKGAAIELLAVIDEINEMQEELKNYQLMILQKQQIYLI